MTDRESYLPEAYYRDDLRTTPWMIVQRRVSDREVESVIARFQHEQLAERFLRAIKPITDHYLALENVDA